MTSSLLPSAQPLVQFTDYYPLPNVAGAFVMVDTSMRSASGQASYHATITISTDGETSAQYDWSACTLEGNTLVITDDNKMVATLSFTPAAGGTQLNGTIVGYAGVVQAASPFAPVELSVWEGTYYAQLPQTQAQDQTPQYSYAPALQVNADQGGTGAVWWASGDAPLQQISNFWYDYGMFVIGLVFEDGSQVLYEMGTSSGWGRVAGDAQDGQMLVSIQLQQPAPHL